MNSNTADEWFKTRNLKLVLNVGQTVKSCEKELCQLQGVEQIVSDEGGSLRIEYDLQRTRFSYIRQKLESSGFRLENSLLQRFKYAFICYMEDIQRQAEFADVGWNDHVRNIYISRYRHHRHGCRDDRPRHWQTCSKNLKQRKS